MADLLRGKLFGDSTTVLTSATLTIGGSFDAMASAWGMNQGLDRAADAADTPNAPDTPDTKVAWRGLDVGSPFDHAK